MRCFKAASLSLAAFVLSVAPLASAAELEWNQERVAALARDLIKPLEVLEAELRSRPPVPGKEEARAVVINDVERLHSRAKELAERLGNGAGRAETAALFREIEALGHQTAIHSRDYPARFEMHVPIERAQGTIIQLARYYGKAPS